MNGLQDRSSPLEVFLGKGVLRICSKFTGEHPCRSVISIILLYNFAKITLRHGCSPVNFLHISRTTFNKTTFEGLLLIICLSRKISCQGDLLNIFNSLMLNVLKWLHTHNAARFLKCVWSFWDFMNLWVNFLCYIFMYLCYTFYVTFNSYLESLVSLMTYISGI